MKKIKYRAWSKSRGCWIYWDDLAISPVTPAENYEDGQIWQSGPPNGELTQTIEEVDDIEYNLFIGLKDKNGKDVYEGDILLDNKNYPQPLRGYILFNGWNFEYRHFNEELGVWMETILFPKLIQGVEIVGNIFENPNLQWKDFGRIYE